jgi:hypothetical protein
MDKSFFICFLALTDSTAGEHGCDQVRTTGKSGFSKVCPFLTVLATSTDCESLHNFGTEVFCKEKMGQNKDWL